MASSTSARFFQLLR
ncbi:hypothetical protein ECPA23_1418, partial [Escherichia coli PA23]